MKNFLVLICCAILISLAGCNMPAQENPQPGMDVTQAYQTVEAQLTQAVGQTQVLTATSTLTMTEATTTPTPETASPTPPIGSTASLTPQKGCDQAAAAYPKIDITIDDDTEMTPGQTFTKVWRVANAGSCTWTVNYTVVWFSGQQLNAPASVPVNFNVAPGQTLDISVDMVAPLEPGTYQSNWKIRNANGDLFGIGPNGEAPFWARIKVLSSGTAGPTLTPTLAVTPSPTPGIQASGSVTLKVGDYLDLDELLVNAGGDWVFQSTADDPAQHQLVPLGSTGMAVFGGGQPTMGDCQAMGLVGAPVTVNGLAIGTYLCYKTDQGRLGWARITAFDAVAGTITLNILTWKLS
jgi:hypothetical protein